jgi:Rrf2 family protein
VLSRKAKYGLKALIHLAAHAGEGPILIETLAERERIPRKFLEQILLEVKRHGFLTSRTGRGGGYQLGKPPDQITMGAVVRLLDGPLAPVACVSVTAYGKCDECPDEMTCGVRLVMKEVRDAIADILDNTTLADVLRRIERAKRRSRP